MKKILMIILLAVFLSASNPKAYAVLGDVIYDNVQKIEKLKYIKEYQIYNQQISKYVSEVDATKKLGYTIESAAGQNVKKIYLTKLRKLSKENDFFVRSAEINYKTSIEDNNNPLFSQMINSGLIDTQKHKQEIIDYYLEHSDDINASGVIQSYLDEDAMLKAKRDAQAVKYKTKKMREAEKIKRIRENDIEAQRKLEERLQEEVNKKKLEIRKNQKRELAK